MEIEAKGKRVRARRRSSSSSLTGQRKAGLGRQPDGTVIAKDEWWKNNTEEKADLMKFRQGMPDYLPLLDKMFDGVAADGSTSFCSGQAAALMEILSSDEEGDDEQEDPATDDLEEPFSPPSQRPKRASSTSTTASGPKKRSKSLAVRAMNNNMRQYINIANRKLMLMEKIREKKREAVQEVVTMSKARKIKVVNRMAREMGVSALGTPELWNGVMNIIHDEFSMDLFMDINTNNDGRIALLKKLAGDGGSSSTTGTSDAILQQIEEDYDWMLEELMDDDDEAFIICMYQYAIHIDKHLT